MQHLKNTNGSRSLLIVATALLQACSPTSDSGKKETGQLLTRSQNLANQYGLELKSELQQALANGGPTKAILVCREKAPRIALRISKVSGATISRTSLKSRNPVNAPEDWQLEVLRDFDKQGKIAVDSPPPEFYASAEPGLHGFRYMRAIPTAPLCLTCHGSQLSDDVRNALETHYPHDLAVGYEQGEIRGAFSVSWPLAN
ncbi:MAG: DUF3365 domain-containing protein [Gammaproteobacteria bacterium]|nr:DUF3365 domain-containing protein [Gammaproteobacteria bacterium]